MPVHGGTHYTRTSCLCGCHWGSSGCDDKECRKLVASEKKREAAMLVAPVTAHAGERIVTPFGLSKFIR